MNPKAGKQTAKTALFTLCDRFCAMQDTIQVYVTQYAGHAQKLAKTSEGCCDILVCIGGDGTWNEVISGIMEIDNKPVPVSYTHLDVYKRQERENAFILGRHESHSFTQRFAFAYMSVHVVQQAVLPAVPALFETDNVLPCVQYNAAVKQETVHRHRDNQI